MLNLLLTFLLVQVPVSPTTITAMSFNIRYDNPDDGESAWRYRMSRVVKEIAEAELIGIQEALSHQVKQLASELPDYEWVGVGRDDGGEKGEFAPLFFKATVFEVLESTTLWLSETPDIPGSIGWDAAIPRIATSVHLRVRGTEIELQVINTHFDHRGVQARLQSAKLLTEYIHKFARPVILLGDLNATPDSAVLSVFTDSGSLHDTRFVTKTLPQGPDGTFSGFLENNQLNKAPRIDYILVTSDWEVDGYKTIVSVENGRYISDHLPVKAKLQLSE
ncbi:MAG: endonuclease/exonuclease/phosphatase family protein [Bacteroidetes bacterium]|nr:endonuclease/exonuclease/phosphatase family protein [Bacteroidota bacterium]MCY4204385.1 endonuclease/exonuclease/phosphatase family protein [Bacteroidota bacterium]